MNTKKVLICAKKNPKSRKMHQKFPQNVSKKPLRVFLIQFFWGTIFF